MNNKGSTQAITLCSFLSYETNTNYPFKTHSMYALENLYLKQQYPIYSFLLRCFVLVCFACTSVYSVARNISYDLHIKES